MGNLVREKDEAVYKKLVTTAYHATGDMPIPNSTRIAFAGCGKNQHQRRHKNSTARTYF